jgi:hypothetical protein
MWDLTHQFERKARMAGRRIVPVGGSITDG